MRAALLLLALTVAGCAAPAPEGRNIPLDVPPARELLVEPGDLPPGFNATSRSRGDSAPWPGVVDQAGVQMSRFRNGTSMPDQVTCGVWSFGTPEEAHAMVEDVVGQMHGNATARPWGDEAFEGSFGQMQDRRDAVLVLRKGTVSWVIGATEASPYADDLRLEGLAAAVLARLDAQA